MRELLSGRRFRLSSSLLLIIVSVGLLQLFSLAKVAQSELKPNALDRQITLAVANLMGNRHLSKHPIDDEISERGLKQYLKSLDPQKIYFMQSDIDEFDQKKDDLDDLLLKGDVSFAFTVFNRFLERLDERVQLADQLIDTPQDFTVDEDMITDAESLSYAKTLEEMKDRWRKRIKYNILVLKTDKEEKSELTISERLKKRYSSYAKRMHQFDSEEITELYLTAMTSSFDPHSTYFSRGTFENFMIQMRLKLEGIGASLQSEDGLTIVKRIVPGGAAAKNGKLQVDDRIVSVGQGEDGEMVDIADMKLDDVVALIRGDAGTIVRLGVMPAGGNELKTYKITREKIELKDSEAKGEVFDDGKKADGSPYKIGVIDLPSFYSDMEGARLGQEDFKSSTRDTAKLLEKFKSEGVDAVVLDLRSNGGGSLPEAIDCTGLFIGTGPVVQVKDSLGRVRVHDDVAEGVVWDGPLVVLSSKFSASASEILAGAIKDYERGIIVGDTSSHGKGTVQSLINVSEFLSNSPRPQSTMGALKVTMQQFYRPGGRSTQKKGVEADIVLPSLSDHLKGISEGDLDFAVEFDQVKKADYATLGMVNSDMIKQLTERSQARWKMSEDFAKLIKNIANYDSQKEKKTVTLNEKKFLAQREEFDAEKEDQKTIEDQVNPEEAGIKRDFYMNEVLDITVDYIEMLKAKGIAKLN